MTTWVYKAQQNARPRNAATYVLSLFLATMQRFHWLGNGWLQRVYCATSSCRKHFDFTGHVTEGYDVCIEPILGENAPISQVRSWMVTRSRCTGSCRLHFDFTPQVTDGYDVRIEPILGDNAPISLVGSGMVTTSP